MFPPSSLCRLWIQHQRQFPVHIEDNHRFAVHPSSGQWDTAHIVGDSHRVNPRDRLNTLLRVLLNTHPVRCRVCTHLASAESCTNREHMVSTNGRRDQHTHRVRSYHKQRCLAGRRYPVHKGCMHCRSEYWRRSQEGTTRI